MGEFHPGRFDHARCTSFLSFVDPRALCGGARLRAAGRGAGRRRWAARRGHGAPGIRHSARRTGRGVVEHRAPGTRADRLRPAPGGGVARTGYPRPAQCRGGLAACPGRQRAGIRAGRKRCLRPAPRTGACAGDARCDGGTDLVHRGGHRHAQERCEGAGQPEPDRCGQRYPATQQRCGRPARCAGQTAALADPPGPAVQRLGVDPHAVAARAEPQPCAGAGERQASPRNGQSQYQRRAGEGLHRGRSGHHPDQRHRTCRGAARRCFGTVRFGRHRRGDQRHPQVRRQRRVGGR